MKRFIKLNNRNIVVNADDFGRTKTRSDAIDLCFKNGIIDRATIMVNMPYAEYATELARKGEYVEKIGLHLNLVEGTPVLAKTKNSFLCKNGRFNGILLRSRYHLFLSKNERRIIYDEVEAQIKKYKSLGFNLYHMDSHHHVHTKTALFILIKKLLKKYDFSSVRIARNVFDKGAITRKRKIYLILFNNILLNSRLRDNVDFFGPISSFNNMNVNQGKIEIMVHPDMVNGEIIDTTNEENILMVDRKVEF